MLLLGGKVIMTFIILSMNSTFFTTSVNPLKAHFLPPLCFQWLMKETRCRATTEDVNKLCNILSFQLHLWQCAVRDKIRHAL